MQYNIDTTLLRQANAAWSDNKWVFPIRMENSSGIVWVENLMECFARMKRPLTETTWKRMLDRGVIAAETPDEASLLRRWWQEGWDKLPQLPSKSTAPIPILISRTTGMGETLETIYGNLSMATAHLPFGKDIIAAAAMGHTESQQRLPFNVKALRAISQIYTEVLLKEPLPWTRFAADNTILGHYKTATKLRQELRLSTKDWDRARHDNYNRLPDGTWVWCDDWGLVPISPDDEVLGLNWRTKYAPENKIESKIDF